MVHDFLKTEKYVQIALDRKPISFDDYKFLVFLQLTDMNWL